MSDIDPTLAELVRAQAEVIDELRARVASLESAGTRLESAPLESARAVLPDRSSAGSRDDDRAQEPTNRRNFLRLAGVAAAGAAVAVVANPAPAAAATLDYGGVNSAATETSITNTAPGPVDDYSDTAALKATGSSNSVGLLGIANGGRGTGVQGQSNLGYGVFGSSLQGYALYAGSNGRLGFYPHPLITDTAPTSGGYNKGDVVMNAAGDLYACVVAGTNGSAVFRKMAGPLTAGSFHPVTPLRAYDSRGAAAFGIDETRTISIAAAVPAGQKAAAVTVNFTITGTTGNFGYLSAYPADAALPNASVVNWSAPGQSIANGSTVKLGTNNDMKLTCSVNSTHVIVDVMGYWL